MSFVEQLRNLVEDPPPAFAFELGPDGIAHWQNGQVRFERTETADIHSDAAALAELLGRITPAPSANRRRAAALILPDSAARVTLMDFDQFPRKAEDQQALIRFRLKRTLPFDVDAAILRYHQQSRGGSKVDLTVTAIAVETLAPYETAFRNASFHPGFITTASLSAANLASNDAVTLRLSGSTLTLSFFEGQTLRLHRCIELQSLALEELLNVVDPTLAYLEDERKTRPSRIEVCGLDAFGTAFTDHIRETWNLDVQPLRGRHGAVDPNRAGLEGYLTAMGVA